MHQLYLLADAGKVSLYADSIAKPAFVFVKVDGDDILKSRGSSLVKIPAAGWEEIRHKSPVLFDLVDVSDEEMRQRSRHRAASWKELKRLLKPHAAPYKAVLALKRAYRLPTTYEAFLRDSLAQRKAQQKLRDSLNQLQSTAQKKKSQSNAVTGIFRRHRAKTKVIAKPSRSGTPK